MELWDNPIGTDGFEFVEYTAPDTDDACTRLFERMGFRAVGRHRSKDGDALSARATSTSSSMPSRTATAPLRQGAWPQRLRHGVPREGCGDGLSRAAGARAPSRSPIRSGRWS